MCDLVDRLIDKHADFAEGQNLALVAKEYSPEFGGSVCLKYSDGTVSLMVTKSRDGVSYYLCDADWQDDNWYSIDIVWNLLCQNREYRRMKAVNHLSFLKDSFAQIVEIFSSSERYHTAQKLHQLELSRTKKLFG